MRTNQAKPQPKPKSTPQANEGEGGVSAARRYDAGAEKTAKSGAVDGLAKKAAHALDGAEGADLRDAEVVASQGPGAMRAQAPSRDSLDRADDEGMTAPLPKPASPASKARK